jgi:hypothetical protein
MTPGELTILSSDGGELKEIMLGGNSLRGIITSTQDCGVWGSACGMGSATKPCCGKSCLLLYDDIDFNFDNILLLCDIIFKKNFNVDALSLASQRQINGRCG